MWAQMKILLGRQDFPFSSPKHIKHSPWPLVKVCISTRNDRVEHLLDYSLFHGGFTWWAMYLRSKQDYNNFISGTGGKAQFQSWLLLQHWMKIFVKVKKLRGTFGRISTTGVITLWPACLLTSGKGDFMSCFNPTVTLASMVDTRNLTPDLQSNSLNWRMVNHSYNKIPLTSLREIGEAGT